MPKVIVINIINKVVEGAEQHDDLVQPTKLVRTKLNLVVTDKLRIYDVQLPKIGRVKPNWTNKLYCWLYVLETARRNSKSVEEVIKMTTELSDFQKDNGFEQFSKRYEQVTANAELRKEYQLWIEGVMRAQNVMDGAKMQGFEEGREQGLEEGLEQGLEQGRLSEKKEIASSMLLKGFSIEQVVELTHLTHDEVTKLSNTI